MNLDLSTKLTFNQTTVVEVSSDYEDAVMVEVSLVADDSDLSHRTFQLKVDEIELLICTLELYKNRILKKQGRVKT